MSFGAPAWLWALLAVPLLALVLVLAERRRRRRLGRYAAPGTLGRVTLAPAGPVRAVRAVLLLAAVALVVLALARPQWGRSEQEVQLRGLDLVLAVDLSRSMLATDVAPSRLVVARRIGEQIARRLASDRVALVGFAGQAATLCPLTLDRGALALYLEALDPELFAAQGSDLGAAIDAATRLVEPEDTTRRVLVLLTDGEDHAGNAGEAAARAAAAGLTVYAVGLGTAEGAPVPAERDEQGRIARYKTGQDGRPVISRLDAATLRAVAERGGGAFVRATGFGEGVVRVVEEIERLDRGEFGETIAARRAERYRWPLAAAFVLALVEAALVDRRRREATP